MKYVVVGAGGTGGCIGAYLAADGRDVTFIARGEHLKAIKKNSLTVESSDRGTFKVSAGACTMEEYNDKADVIFVCVKYYSIDEAIAFVRKAAKSDTVVIPILNVFGTGSLMQEKLPDLTVTDGCIYIYSFIKKAGVIAKPSDIFKLYFGLREGQDRRSEDRLKTVESDLRSAGIAAYLSDDIKKDTFRKFTYISPIGAAGLMCSAKAGDFVKEGKARNTLVALMTELLALGKAMGIEYTEDMVKVNLDIIAGLQPDADTSMQRDIAAGHSSEADGLIHSVVRLGKKYNVPMPTYERVAEVY
jgi:2-dehydropantoate 2-reductase